MRAMQRVERFTPGASRWRRAALRGLPLFLLLLLLFACSSANNRKVLNFFFDGVPDPNAPDVAPTPYPWPTTTTTPDILFEAEPSGPVPELMTAAELAAGGLAAIDQLSLRPVPKRVGETWDETGAELEKVGTWEEALSIMPTDMAGGVDWVKATLEGLTIPQLVLDVANVSTPYNLDNLVVGGAEDPDSPFLDFTVKMVPEGNPFFEVAFPHSSHTLFLTCSSCHPGVQEWDVPMDRILAGQACGKCHGRVSFNPETSCARCHPNLMPPPETMVEAEVVRADEEPIARSEEVIERGKELYGQYCMLCHGEDGDGKGRMARFLATKPRDFTSGKYKIRSTLGTDPPTDLDLFRTITRGIPRSSMPAWPALSYEDRWALVHYVKSFSEIFDVPVGIADALPGIVEIPGPQPIEIPEPPDPTPEVLAQGKELYSLSGCDACHGIGGGGDGPSAKLLRDDSGTPIRPYSFTSGQPPKGGDGPEDIYRVIRTGFAGTPMPGFAESLTKEQTWALTRYVLAFRNSVPRPLHVRGDIHFQRPGSEPEQSPPSDDPFADPFGESDDPFADDPFAEPAQDDPFADDPFAETAQDDPFADDPFAEPAQDDPFADDPFAETAAAQPVNPDLVEYPPATFPHWFHRIRLKCANCHPKVFEMKAGANPVTMDGMRAGLYCARCHNGKVAWEIGFTTCHDCHRQNTDS